MPSVREMTLRVVKQLRREALASEAEIDRLHSLMLSTKNQFQKDVYR